MRIKTHELRFNFCMNFSDLSVCFDQGFSVDEIVGFTANIYTYVCMLYMNICVYVYVYMEDI